MGVCSAPEGTRTLDLLVKSQLLYQLSYERIDKTKSKTLIKEKPPFVLGPGFCLVVPVGLEPTCPKDLIYSQASQPIAQRHHIVLRMGLEPMTSTLKVW